MSVAPLCVILALAVIALLAWLLRPRHDSFKTGNLPHDLTLLRVTPHHYQYFPQIRQALCDGDRQYLHDVAPPDVAKRVMKERRAVARRFLSGLLEDFSKLERLARIVAALSPAISEKQETERLFLGLKFRLLYGLVWLRLFTFTGRVPFQQIEHLSGLVGRLALQMEQSMAEINALSSERLSRGISA